MRYIGRIITTTKIDDVPDLIEVTSDSSSISEDTLKIPTLIIGYKNAVKLCGKINITKKKIKENLFWTFSKRERRSDYIADIEDFYGIVSKFLSKCCDYEYVDMISGSKEKKHHITEIFSETRHRKIVYQTDTMYYIYYPHERKVYGVAKSVLEFLGFPEDIIARKADGKISFLVDGEKFQYSGISVQKFMTPLLYYLMTF